ncbi:hypothetical protein [Mycolicibacterium cosmeticum]|uniref:hypothetical protein n=1 Tax=Mycolicibacterium cosmeticum TaxID=258533 RepID=UPI003204ADEB
MAAVQPGDSHWTDQTSFTALYPAVGGGDARTHGELSTARRNAGGPTAPPGKLLAELTFGFWVFLTSTRHTNLILTPHLDALYPAGSQRGQIPHGLDELRKARNRVAHHEPVRVAEVNKLTRRINRYAGYVSPELAIHPAHQHRKRPPPFTSVTRRCDSSHPSFASLDPADRRLALALLSCSDSLRVYVNGQRQCETIGQHRICWARTADIAAVSVWFDATTVAPPRDATLLQRG